RVVHTEDAHAPVDPEEDDAPELLPECAPVRALEVERVDVLVLLRRVLRMLDRAVGTAAEPGGVRPDPRVVGRALERQIERDLEAVLARSGEQAVEVAERAELGMDGVVPALGGADGPGAAGVGGRGDRRIVPPLAVRAADG